jgi:hypothetical protein
MEMNRLKLLEKQKKEAERLAKQQAQQEQNRIHNKGFDKSRSKLNFKSQEESNAERKKYLKERYVIQKTNAVPQSVAVINSR